MLLRTLACSLRSIALVLHWHSCSDKLQLRGKKKKKKEKWLRSLAITGPLHSTVILPH